MPRRKADQSGGKGQMAKSKGPKRPRTGQVPMMEAAVPSASQSLVDLPQPTIDYAKLATEILKQQAVQQGANAEIPTPQSQAMSIRQESGEGASCAMRTEVPNKGPVATETVTNF